MDHSASLHSLPGRDFCTALLHCKHITASSSLSESVSLRQLTVTQTDVAHMAQGTVVPSRSPFSPLPPGRLRHCENTKPHARAENNSIRSNLLTHISDVQHNLPTSAHKYHCHSYKTTIVAATATATNCTTSYYNLHLLLQCLQDYCDCD